MLFSFTIFLVRMHFMWCCRSDVGVLYNFKSPALHCLEEDQVPYWMDGVRNLISIKMCLRKQRRIWPSSNVPKPFRGHAGRMIKDFFHFFLILQGKYAEPRRLEEKKWSPIIKPTVLVFKKLQLQEGRSQCWFNSQMFQTFSYVSKHAFLNLPAKTCIVTWSKSLKDRKPKCELNIFDLEVNWHMQEDCCVCHVYAGESREQHLIRGQIPWIFYTVSPGISCGTWKYLFIYVLP